MAPLRIQQRRHLRLPPQRVDRLPIGPLALLGLQSDRTLCFLELLFESADLLVLGHRDAPEPPAQLELRVHELAAVGVIVLARRARRAARRVTGRAGGALAGGAAHDCAPAARRMTVRHAGAGSGAGALEATQLLGQHRLRVPLGAHLAELLAEALDLLTRRAELLLELGA